MQNEDADLETYAKENRIEELFTRLARALIIHRPGDPIAFLIEALGSDDIPDEYCRYEGKPFFVDIYFGIENLITVRGSKLYSMTI